MQIKSWLAYLCVLMSVSTWAQKYVEPVEWVEEKTPPIPTFSKSGLIPIDMPSHVSLKVGIDPATISVGTDGVVRYVMVMSNATGSVNAVFEGIRCTTDEVKTYARFNSSGNWSEVSDTQWKGINDNMPSKHAFAFARQGGCQLRLAPTKAEILQAITQRQKASKSPLNF
jgi:hypothetical protein